MVIGAGIYKPETWKSNTMTLTTSPKASSSPHRELVRSLASGISGASALPTVESVAPTAPKVWGVTVPLPVSMATGIGSIFSAYAVISTTNESRNI